MPKRSPNEGIRLVRPGNEHETRQKGLHLDQRSMAHRTAVCLVQSGHTVLAGKGRFPSKDTPLFCSRCGGDFALPKAARHASFAHPVRSLLLTAERFQWVWLEMEFAMKARSLLFAVIPIVAMLSSSAQADLIASITNGSICKPLSTNDQSKLEFRATALKNVSDGVVWVSCSGDTHIPFAAPTMVAMAVAISSNTAAENPLQCVLREVFADGTLAQTLWRYGPLPPFAGALPAWEIALANPLNSVSVACALPPRSQVNSVLVVTSQ